MDFRDVNAWQFAADLTAPLLNASIEGFYEGKAPDSSLCTADEC